MKFIVPTEEDSKSSQQDILKLKTQEVNAFRLSNASEFLRSSGYTLLNILLLNSTWWHLIYGEIADKQYELNDRIDLKL